RSRFCEGQHLLMTDIIDGYLAVGFVEKYCIVWRPADLGDLVSNSRQSDAQGQRRKRQEARQNQATGLIQQEAYAHDDNKEPNRWCGPEHRERGKTDYPCEAATNIQAVAGHTIGIGLEAPSQHLPQAHEHQSDQDKKYSHNEFDRYGERGDVWIAGF